MLGETMSFSHGESWCTKCGTKESYNLNNYYGVPEKCRICGAQMTTYQREKVHQMLNEHLKKHHELYKISSNM